jgi:hypothetical protein
MSDETSFDACKCMKTKGKYTNKTYFFEGAKEEGYQHDKKTPQYHDQSAAKLHLCSCLTYPPKGYLHTMITVFSFVSSKTMRYLG